MENPRPEKVAVVDEVKARFNDADAAVLTEYRGLDVDAMADLRRALRDAGGEYKIYKNSLVRFAAAELGLGIEDLLVGPTAIAFVTQTPSGEPGDAVNVAKAIKTFAKDHPALLVKGGLLGENLLAADEVHALADVAPRDELLARLAYGLAAPMQQFAGLLQALPQRFAYALQALIAEGGGPEARDDVVAEAPVEAQEPEQADSDPADEVEAAPEAPTTSDEVPDEPAVESAAEPSGDAASETGPNEGDS